MASNQHAEMLLQRMMQLHHKELKGSALIFPNPKTVDIHNERAAKQKTQHTNKKSSPQCSAQIDETYTSKNIYIYIHLCVYIYTYKTTLSPKIPQINIPSPNCSQLMKMMDQKKTQVTRSSQDDQRTLFTS